MLILSRWIATWFAAKSNVLGNARFVCKRYAGPKIQTAFLLEMPERDFTGRKTLIGQMVIVRCRDAGVHIGDLVAVQGRMVDLKNARRLWSWNSDRNTLNEISLNGVVAGRISETVDKICLLEACEIIPVAENAKGKLEPRWD